MVPKFSPTSDVADALDTGAPLPLSYQKQGVLQTAQRMRAGLLLYPAIWLLLMQVDDFASRHPVFAYGNTLALALAAAARWVYHSGLKDKMARDFIRTRNIFRACSLLGNLYWGVLCAMVLAAPDAHNLRWLALICTVGITAGGTVIVAIDSVLPLLYPLCTLCPTVLVALPQGGSTNIALASLCAVLFAYSLGISRMVSSEYWSRQRAQAMLEERARELETLSRTDALTQIPNRLKFQESLNIAWRDARRRGESLAVAMVDLDYFKHINDQYGHPFGDLCLQAAAANLAATLRRPTDMVARYGGEEFVILMPNTDIHGAQTVAQAMLEKIATTFVSQGESATLLSCSIGIAACKPEHSSEAQALVQNADLALYAAKQAGRGRVMAQTDEPPAPRASEARAAIPA